MSNMKREAEKIEQQYMELQKEFIAKQS